MQINWMVFLKYGDFKPGLCPFEDDRTTSILMTLFLVLSLPVSLTNSPSLLDSHCCSRSFFFFINTPVLLMFTTLHVLGKKLQRQRHLRLAVVLVFSKPTCFSISHCVVSAHSTKLQKLDWSIFSCLCFSSLSFWFVLSPSTSQHFWNKFAIITH